MQKLGLSTAQLDLYHAALRAPVRVERTRLLVMSNEHDIERDVELLTLDGQVSVSTANDNGSTRSLGMTVADPSGSLGLDTFAPTGNFPIYPQKMIQVRHSLWTPGIGAGNAAGVGAGGVAGGDWVECAVHTGPFTKCLPGDDGAIELEAGGKELLCNGAPQQDAWQPKTPKTDIIRALLKAAGEREAFMEIPDLPKRRTVNRFILLDTDNPWRRACQLADSMGYELYYDGRGVAVMRRRPKAVAFRFGPAMVLGDLEEQTETGPIANTWEVLGGKPKGSDSRVRSGRPRIELDEDHEWSAKNLGRNGVPRRIVERVTNDQFTRVVDCRYEAYKRRDAALSMTTTRAAEVVMVPHLDLFDRTRVDALDDEREIVLREFTIPVAGQSQALGTTRRTGDAWMPNKHKPKKKRGGKGGGKGSSGGKGSGQGRGRVAVRTAARGNRQNGDRG